MMTRFRRVGALCSWFGRFPELCGLVWLGLLATAIGIHTHATTQAPIYDGFSYYQKAYNFWEAVHAGKWFNPLNVEPTFRPPGTILMSYPFGFSPDPRGFYFRSVYFPIGLLFLSVLIAAYRADDDFSTRLRIMLTAIFFTTITLPYHFEFGADTSGAYWGLVDGFLAGLAAVAAACAWRGTAPGAWMWIWAVATAGFASALSILVKPSGLLVAAVAAVAWGAFGLGALVDCRGPGMARRRLALRLFVGAGLIALIDAVVIAAAINSHYLSHENLAYGQGAITIMKAELSLPLSLLWRVVNAGLGGPFIIWATLALMICLWRLSVKDSAPMTKRGLVACLASVAALIFGVWFWFFGSGGANQIRYFVPFFVMAMIWLVPVALEAWNRVPPLLTLSLSSVMTAAALNLIAVLLVPGPSVAWQQFAGVDVTAAFPPQTLEALKRLVAQNPAKPVHLYIMSFGANDAILDSLVDQRWLLDHGSQSLLLQRPIDWQRSSTIRIAEIGAADMLLINPPQARPDPAGEKVNNLSEEQGVLTAWADKLDVSDGVSVFFSAPSAKIFTVTDRVKFRESLRRLVARYHWDSTFKEANDLPGP